MAKAKRKVHPFVKFMEGITQEVVAERLGTPQSSVSYQFRMCQKNPAHLIPGYYIKAIAQLSNNRFTSKQFVGLTHDMDIRRAS